MNPEIKAAIDLESERNCLKSWDKTTGDRGARMYHKAFKAGAEYGYKLGLLVGKIDFLESTDSGGAIRQAGRLRKELQELL